MMRWLVMTGLVVVGSGCTDPIVGSWEATDPPDYTCSGRPFEATMDIDDNLEGEGKMHVVLDSDTCGEFDFELEITDKGDGDYEFEVTLDGLTVDGSSKIEVDCELDDDELECDAADIGGLYSTWRRTD